MKRLVAVLSCAAATLTLTSAFTGTAQAAAAKSHAKNPVSAVRAQYAPGHGVSIKQWTKIAGQVLARTNGKLEFGRSGVKASDLTGKLNIKASQVPEDEQALATPERTIKVGHTAYISGGPLGSELSSDKTWLKVPDGPPAGVLGGFGQPISAAETSTLKYLIGHGKAHHSGSTTYYSGKVTLKQLRKVSAWSRSALLAVKPTAKIGWKLYVGSDRLPARLVTTYKLGLFGSDVPLTVDTRYSGWGTKVDIKAPPAADVQGLNSLDEEDSEKVLTGGLPESYLS